MHPAKRRDPIPAGVVLVAAVLVMAAGVPGARTEASGNATARILERPSEANAMKINVSCDLRRDGIQGPPPERQ